MRWCPKIDKYIWSMSVTTLKLGGLWDGSGSIKWKLVVFTDKKCSVVVFVQSSFVGWRFEVEYIQGRIWPLVQKWDMCKCERCESSQIEHCIESKFYDVTECIPRFSECCLFTIFNPLRRRAPKHEIERYHLTNVHLLTTDININCRSQAAHEGVFLCLSPYS